MIVIKHAPHTLSRPTFVFTQYFILKNDTFDHECIIDGSIPFIDQSHKCSTSDFCIVVANLLGISFKNLRLKKPWQKNLFFS